MIYGRTVRGPMAILKELWTGDSQSPDIKTTYEYVLDLKERLEETCKLATTELSKSQARYKRYYDRNARDRKFKVGDQVLLLLPTQHNKLQMQWQGPYPVKEKVGIMDYRVEVRGKLKLYHANLLKKYEVRSTEDDESNKVNVKSVGIMQCVATGVIRGQEYDLEQETDILHNSDFEIVETPSTDSVENIDNVHINDDLLPLQKTEVNLLLREFSDTLSDIPGKCKVGNHDIKLISDTPVRIKPYPTHHAVRDTINAELHKMIDLDVIESSDSPYSAPYVLIDQYLFSTIFFSVNRLLPWRHTRATYLSLET
jgi:hypothetical protein